MELEKTATPNAMPEHPVTQQTPVDSSALAAALPRPAAHAKKSLLYMYVEDYLGFKQEGFNFAMSPRFRMNCDGDKRILTRADAITKHETYWEDHPFFGENISGLSLLIGENGSGKTTVFRLLLSWLRDLAQGNLPSLQGVLVFRETKETKKHPTHQDSYIRFPEGAEITPSDSLKHIKLLSCAEAKQFLSDVSFTYYTDTMTDLELFRQGEDEGEDETEANGQFIDRSLNARLCSIPLHPGRKHLSRYELRSLDFAFQVKHLLKLKSNSKNRNENDDARPIPIDYLRFSVRTKWETHPINKLLKELQATKQATIADFSSLLNSAESCFYAWRKLCNAASNKEAILLAVAEGVLWSFVSTVLRNAEEDTVEIIRTMAAGLFLINTYLVDDRESNLNQAETYENTAKIVADFLANVSGIDRSRESVVRTHAELSVELLRRVGWIENIKWENTTSISAISDSIWTGKITKVPKIMDDTTTLDSFQSFVEGYTKLPHLLDYLRLEWHSPSSGEDNYSNLLALFSALVSRESNRWVFFDEPDNAFHPKWKQTIVYRILRYCSDQNDAAFQLWISSHSPIMLSDVPAQAAIRLKRIDETFSKINATERGSKLSPFAQQIYTLFDDDFFMEKGVVGAFAKDTIADLYQILKKVEKSQAKTEKHLQPKMDFIEAILAQIQEPVLRGYLVNRIQFSREKFARLEQRK